MTGQGSSRRSVHWPGRRGIRSLWDPWLLPVAATPILGVALATDQRPLLRSSCVLAAVVLLALTTGFVARERLRRDAGELLLESLIATAAIAFLGWGLGFPDTLPDGVERTQAVLGLATLVIAVGALTGIGWLASVDEESRRPSLVALATALLSAAVGSILAVQALFEDGVPHWAPDLAIVACIASMSAAIVHPSRRALRVAALDLQRGHVARRAAVTVGAVLVGPLLLVIPLAADSLSLPVVAALSVGLTALAAAHIYRLLRRWGALEHDVYHDSLTGLPNRQYFNRRLHAAIEQAQRGGHQMSVLFLDLDHFKDVNDTLGHAAGNDLLSQVAARLRSTLPQEHTVARLGGDEFAVLVPVGAEDPDDPFAAASDATVRLIHDAFGEPFDLGHRMVTVTPSIGAANFPADGQDASALLERADSEMYQSKSRRRAARRDTTATVPVEPSRDIELALRRAIQEDRLVLHYQPKVDLRTGRVLAAEAFLRWRHPSGGLMMPGSFLPIAEDNAMMPALAEWVLLEACAENQRWRDAGAPSVRVAVNVAPSQLRSRRMPELVERVLRFTRLPAELLELELSSESLELDVRIVREEVATLRGMGVRCVVDDIGRAGRIEDLARLEVDAIELSRHHVHQIDTDGGRVAASVLALAQALGIETVAEGVESTDQLEFVREHGCTAVQGFLVARPAVGEEIEHLLGLQFDEVADGGGPAVFNPVA